MNNDLRHKLAGVLILIIGAVVLAFVGAPYQLVAGVIGGYMIAYLTSAFFQGKQRETALGVLGFLAVLTFVLGIATLTAVGHVVTILFSLGLLAGGIPGATFGQPPEGQSK